MSKMSNHYLIIPEIGEIFYTNDASYHKEEFRKGLFGGIAEIIDITDGSKPLRLAFEAREERWEEIER
jgi:hypothetical protein